MSARSTIRQIIREKIEELLEFSKYKEAQEMIDIFSGSVWYGSVAREMQAKLDFELSQRNVMLKAS